MNLDDIETDSRALMYIISVGYFERQIFFIIVLVTIEVLFQKPIGKTLYLISFMQLLSLFTN